jgi:hypothetical protein
LIEGLNVCGGVSRSCWDFLRLIKSRFTETRKVSAGMTMNPLRGVGLASKVGELRARTEGSGERKYWEIVHKIPLG